MSEGKHTPTPWRVSDADAAVILADDQSGNSDVPFAVAFCEPCVPMNGDGDFGQFNAARIVRAVNAYDTLHADLQFWIGIAGEAIDALDACAGDEDEGWDRQQHAECEAARIRAKYYGREKRPTCPER